MGQWMKQRVSGFRRGTWAIAAVGMVWLFALTLGLRTMLNYEDGPAEQGAPPRQWPNESAVVREPGTPMVVVFAHPKCPCTDATVSELSILMTRLQHKAKAVVIFELPSGLPQGWQRTELWRSAETIPGVSVITDEGGAEAKRFGAQASGQTMLYDGAGQLLFSGGITVSRGHSGDNAGRAAILSLVTTGRAETERTSVYGCSLHDPTTRADKGETTWLKSVLARVR